MKLFTKTAATLAILIAAGNTAVNAGAYDVERFWASGENWTMRYDENMSADNGSLVIEHDEATETVTISVVWSEFQHQNSCHVTPDSVGDGDSGSVAHTYFKALEVLENYELIEYFHVQSWGGVCEEIGRVEYREDITKAEFSCDNAFTYWGQSVYVVGNTPALGNWDPAKAVKLDATNYPNWSGSVVVENNADIEWKCIKRDEDQPGMGIEWQSGANNFFNSANTDAVNASF
jgi:hypothetical protein|tara:strand:- start:7374 stop:8072 length:699 start_codon:yes stop_codon:yes gene_type:complete